MRRGRTLIQHDWCPYKKGKFGHRDDTNKGKTMWRDTEKRCPSTTQGEGLKQILLSQPLDGTRLADTLILDLDSRELEDHKFLLLKAPTLSQWPWKTNIWHQKLCFITYILLWKTLFVFKTSGSTQEYIYAFMLFVICTVIEKKKKTQHPVKANFRRFLWLRKNTVTLQQESPTGNIF